AWCGGFYRARRRMGDRSEAFWLLCWWLTRSWPNVAPEQSPLVIGSSFPPAFRLQGLFQPLAEQPHEHPATLVLAWSEFATNGVVRPVPIVLQHVGLTFRPVRPKENGGQHISLARLCLEVTLPVRPQGRNLDDQLWLHACPRSL